MNLFKKHVKSAGLTGPAAYSRVGQNLQQTKSPNASTRKQREA
jgi:hypothetical protein